MQPPLCQISSGESRGTSPEVFPVFPGGILPIPDAGSGAGAAPSMIPRLRRAIMFVSGKLSSRAIFRGSSHVAARFQAVGVCLGLFWLSASGSPPTGPASEPDQAALLRYVRDAEYGPSSQPKDALGRPFHGPRLHFTNRAQNLRAYFDREGWEIISRTDPDPTWKWVFQLSSVGRAGDLDPVATAAPRIQGKRIEYDRGGVIEWYVNDPRGIEQGFDIASPPDGSGPLLLEAKIDSSLSRACPVSLSNRWIVL